MLQEKIKNYIIQKKKKKRKKTKYYNKLKYFYFLK